MKKIISLALLTLFLGQISFAQEAAKSAPCSKMAFVGQVSAGVLGGDQTSRVFHVKNGVAFANHFFATLGLGVENYYDVHYLPIFIDFRYNILNRKTTPFVSLSSGYLQPLGRNYNSHIDKGGYTGGVKIGVSHFFSEHIGFETSVGYRYSWLEREDNNYYYAWDPLFVPYTTEYNMNRFELSVGLIFK